MRKLYQKAGEEQEQKQEQKQEQEQQEGVHMKDERLRRYAHVCEWEMVARSIPVFHEGTGS